jgi:hypothetical protein
LDQKLGASARDGRERTAATLGQATFHPALGDYRGWRWRQDVMYYNRLRDRLVNWAPSRRIPEAGLFLPPPPNLNGNLFILQSESPGLLELG